VFRFFFFQAEDGIRDFHVTGVQTCALPILGPSSHNDHKGEKEHVIVSGAYTFSSFVERISSLEKANEHLYNVGDNLSFYGTGLAGGWEIESPTFVQSQGIKTGMISQQLVHSYS